MPAQVYAYVFGPGFSQVKHSVRYLVPGIWVYNIWLVVGSFYLGTGRYKPLILSNIAGVVALLLLSSWLIPAYVMSGAGLAASVSFTVAAGVLWLFFVYQYPGSWSRFFSPVLLLQTLQKLTKRK